MCVCFLTAPFKDTKSTCGAAISTVTSVVSGADSDWKEDTKSETERILRNKAANNQRKEEAIKELRNASQSTDRKHADFKRLQRAVDTAFEAGVAIDHITYQSAESLLARAKVLQNALHAFKKKRTEIQSANTSGRLIQRC